MNLKIATVICATIILVGILFWPTLYRYDTITISNNTLPIRINRLTGFTERYSPQGKWIPGEGQKKGKSIPEEERAKVTVTAKQVNNIDYADRNAISELVKELDPSEPKYFSVSIYNGSIWTITNIVFKFKTYETDKDSTIKLIGSNIIHPLTMGNMSIQRTGRENISTFVIDDIKGYKD